MRDNYIEFLNFASNQAKADILTMTTVAESGHPGGSISSLDLYLTTLLFSNIFENSDRIKLELDPISIEQKEYFKLSTQRDMDSFYISHGHTAPAWYAAMGAFEILDREEYLTYYRKMGTLFSGHVQSTVPFIGWDTGSLGQGLSAAAGKALFLRQQNQKSQVYVFMGDGEQQKGQISEARRFIKKYNLTNIHILIDCNKLQVNGNVEKVMPQDIRQEWSAAGFCVLEIDGHDFNMIHESLLQDTADEKNNYVILSNTVSGKGVSFMENRSKYVASAVDYNYCKEALRELREEEKIDYYRKRRTLFDGSGIDSEDSVKKDVVKWGELTKDIKTKSKTYYRADLTVDCKSSYGDTLVEVDNESHSVPVYAFDCDLAIAVKTDKFMHENPGHFYQSGIQEHHTVSCAGSLSKQGALVFYSDFGTFGLYEPYNQHNLNSLNNANLKTVLTHCGLVGEDGKTHNCINYIGVVNSLFDTKLIVPADANQTKDIIRYISKTYGNFVVALARSKQPIICDKEGIPYYNEDYVFRYGVADVIIKSSSNYMIAIGGAFGEAYKACNCLNKKGIDVGLIYISTPLSIDKQLRTILANKNVFVFEEHNEKCGLYKELAEFICRYNICCSMYHVGLKDYGESGDYNELLEKNGLDANSIQRYIEDKLETSKGRG